MVKVLSDVIVKENKFPAFSCCGETLLSCFGRKVLFWHVLQITHLNKKTLVFYELNYTYFVNRTSPGHGGACSSSSSILLYLYDWLQQRNKKGLAHFQLKPKSTKIRRDGKNSQTQQT